MVSKRAISAAEKSMTTLNRRGAELLGERHLSAMTDVSGFGLIGHAAEMVQGGQIDFHINSSDLPLLPDVREYIGLGLVPEGSHKNRDFRLPCLSNSAELDPRTAGPAL